MSSIASMLSTAVRPQPPLTKENLELATAMSKFEDHDMSSIGRSLMTQMPPTRPVTYL
jgi:hypothetical protein